MKYVSDRGQSFRLKDMAPSYLMNAIAHHRKQMDVLQNILNNELYLVKIHVRVRLEELADTVAILEEELLCRDPDKDDDHVSCPEEDSYEH